MAQLTKEYFDQVAAGLATKQAITDLKGELASTEKRIIERIGDAQSELARMVKAGFDATDKQFAWIAELLRVREDVDELKLQMQEIRQALNLKK